MGRDGVGGTDLLPHPAQLPHPPTALMCAPTQKLLESVIEGLFYGGFITEAQLIKSLAIDN